MVLAAVPATAAITFDAASRAATTSTGRTSLSWPHVVGGGADRVLVVGVAVEDASTTDANITAVTFNGVPLIPVPNSKRSGGGTGIIQTQLFYLLSGSLGAAGSRTITVTMQGAVDGISAGAVSLTGASQAAPQAAATNVDTSGADSISTSITSPAANSWSSNVIIRNLIMEKPLAPIDKVLVQYGAHHVWIDHNDFSSDLDNGVDFYDGQIDITHGADFITVSWNIFHDHFKNSLVGNSENTGDEDSGHLRVTYHHNLFTRVDGRNPSIRFGTGHVYNNHYLNIPDYGIASRQNAQVRVENNYFDNVDQPIRADTSLSDVAGQVNQVSTNIFVNSGPNSITTPVSNFVPPYTYRLDAASSVPAIVQQGAGVGKVIF